MVEVIGENQLKSSVKKVSEIFKWQIIISKSEDNYDKEERAFRSSICLNLIPIIRAAACSAFKPQIWESQYWDQCDKTQIQMFRYSPNYFSKYFSQLKVNKSKA